MSNGVRPIGVEPEPERRGPLLAGLAFLVLVGFGAYLASGGLSVSAPTTTADPAPSTGPTTTIFIPGGSELGQQVRGFQGRVRGIATSGDGAVGAWSWSSGEATARVVELPAEASGRWSADRTLVAAVAASSFGKSLYFGPPSNIREVFNGVESFAWHSTDPRTLALVTVPQSDGMRELWRSIPQSTTRSLGTFNASRVTRFDFEATLVAHGDWGYAMSVISPSEARPVQLVTLDPDGNLLAQASFEYVDDYADGRLLVLTQSENDSPRLAITDTALAGAELVGPEDAVGGVLSPNERWLAAVSISPSGATLSLENDDGSVRQSIPLGVDVALPVAWSSDGRWILLRGSPDAPADSDRTQLIFVEAGRREVYVVTTPGRISGLSFEATGAPGPNLAFAG